MVPMNNYVLFLVPLSILLLLDNWLLFRKYLALELDEQQVLLGGLNGRGSFFWVWYATLFILSGLGVGGTFCLHAIMNESWHPFALFIVLVSSHLLCNHAVHRQKIQCTLLAVIISSLRVFDQAGNRPPTKVVFCCLGVNVFCYGALLSYTMYKFPPCGTCVVYSALAWCNMASVVHALVNNFFIWQWGWWEELDNPIFCPGADFVLELTPVTLLVV
jgi:hypothetical protein